MDILHITSFLSRRGGGVAPAVQALARSQRRLVASVRVAGLREKHAPRHTQGSADVPCYLGLCEGPTAFGFSRGLVKHIAELNGAIHVIHSHGLWMYPGCLARSHAERESTPLMVSPHGMLDSWALGNSRLNKRVAGWLYENRNLRAAACIHALCESEYRSIRAYGLKNPVAIIPNGIELPDPSAGPQTPPWASQIGADKKVMLFLGRIHPKKGLVNLIRAWGILKAGKSAGLDDWHLVVAGWSQKGHEGELKRLAQEWNLGTDVSFTGPLYGAAKDAALRAAKVFILPSFSEGLPMAVLEAWAYGLPVVMTRECNLPQGFEAGADLEIRPEVDSVAEGLRSFLGLSESARMQIGRNGLELVRSKFAWPSIAAEMLNVYKWVLGHGSQPHCVRVD